MAAGKGQQPQDPVEQALYDKALAGDMRAIEMWLKKRSAKRWGDEAAGGGDGVKIVDDL